MQTAIEHDNSKCAACQANEVSASIVSDVRAASAMLQAAVVN